MAARSTDRRFQLLLIADMADVLVSKAAQMALRCGTLTFG
jgi:hypothetical protein